MPRTAWLAVGIAAGAILLGATTGLVVAIVGVASLCAAAGLRIAVADGQARGVARRLVPLAIGLLAIGLRGAAGGDAGAAAVAIPSGAGPWVGVVETVGAPRDGNRPATIRLQGNAPVLVAATLPWYPSVVPGDRVHVHGS
ncbi:MAG: hypothetical protein QOI92_882, partial [Chloroflexota bacterium]|nr:hypothetical protein [Chloroflexota bacterium]